MESPAPERLAQDLRRVLVTRQGVALGLWGEAGIGKTHQVGILVREVPYRAVVQPAPLSLRLLLQTLKAPRGLPGWAQERLKALSRGEFPSSEDAAMALAILLEAWAPVLLVLEDLHEAQLGYLELVQHLAQNILRGRGVALLVTSRFLPPQPFRSLRLEPLGLAEVRALVRKELGEVPEAASAWLHTKAQGNPLFTLAYLRHLVERGHLWREGQAWCWHPPKEEARPLTLTLLLEQSLQGVAQGALEDLLVARALMPQGAPSSLWMQMVGLKQEEFQNYQARLEAAGILRQGNFSHPLLRELCLKRASGAQVRLARRALEALKSHPLAQVPFLEAASLPPGELASRLRAAAASARIQGLFLEAARLEGLAAPHAGPEGPRLALDAARILEEHDLPAALRLARLGIAEPEGPPLLARLLARSGQLQEALNLLALLPEAQARTLKPLLLHQGGDHQGVLALWENGLVCENPEGLQATAASALALGRMELTATLLERLKALPLSPRLELQTTFLQALAHYHEGRAGEAEALLQPALDALSASEFPRLRATALVNLSAFLRMQGRYSEMGTYLEEALLLRQKTGEARAYAFAAAALAEVRVEQGRYPEARGLLEEALATLALYPPDRLTANTHAMASLLYRSWGTAPGPFLAVQHAQAALDLARTLDNPRTLEEILFEASLAYTQAGQPERGLALAAEAQGLEKAAGASPYDAFRTLWALGLALAGLGRTQEAQEALATAEARARALNAPQDAERLALEEARLRGDSERAQEALAWFRAQGLEAAAQAVLRSFPELETPQPPSPAALRLEALGPLRIHGQPFRGLKREEFLMAVLEVRLLGEEGVSRLDLLDRLYPGQEEATAQTALRNLVHGLRIVFGSGLVATTSAGYALGSGVSLDVEEFLASGDTRLWRGPLPDGRQATLWTTLHRALREAARDRLESGTEEAARLGLILVRQEPYDLEALALALEAFLRLGRREEMEGLYRQAQERMRDMGESLPPTWQDFLDHRAKRAV